MANQIDIDSRERQATEKDQDISFPDFRRRVLIRECWGTLLNNEGKIIAENVVCATANDRFLIRRPDKYPFWNQKDPYVVAPIVRVPWSVWHRALMDAPTDLNQSLNEIYNLLLDAGLQSVWGIKQLRADLLEDPSQVSDGIPPGETLLVSQNALPNQKVLERVDTGSLSSEGVNIFNLTQSEFNQSALTNDLRLGVLPPRAVKATEVTEASQSLTSVFNGTGKAIEEDFVAPLLEKQNDLCMQMADDMDSDEVKAIIGKERYEQIKDISPKQRFARTVNGSTFKVFGVSQTLSKIKDFRKLTTVMQTIATSDVLSEEFAKEYSFAKFLGEIIRSLDIDEDKIKLDDVDKKMNELGGANQAPAGGQGASNQSQIPQVASSGIDRATEGAPQTEFPSDNGPQ